MTTNAFSILLFVTNNKLENFLNLRHPVALNSLITHVIGEGALKSQVLENASMGNTSGPTSPHSTGVENACNNWSIMHQLCFKWNLGFSNSTYAIIIMRIVCITKMQNLQFQFRESENIMYSTRKIKMMCDWLLFEKWDDIVFVTIFFRKKHTSKS